MSYKWRICTGRTSADSFNGVGLLAATSSDYTSLEAVLLGEDGTFGSALYTEAASAPLASAFDEYTGITYIGSASGLYSLEGGVLSLLFVHADTGDITGICAVNGDVYFTDSLHGRILCHKAGTPSLVELATSLGDVSALCYLNAKLYFVDGASSLGTRSIRVLDLATNAVTTLCSNTDDEDADIPFFKTVSLVTDGTYLYSMPLGSGSAGVQARIVKTNPADGSYEVLVHQSATDTTQTGLRYYNGELYAFGGMGHTTVDRYSTSGALVNSQAFTAYVTDVLVNSHGRWVCASTGADSDGRVYAYGDTSSELLTSSLPYSLALFAYTVPSGEFIGSAHGLADGDGVLIASTGFATLDGGTWAVNVVDDYSFLVLLEAYIGDTSGTYPDAAYVDNPYGDLVLTGTVRKVTTSRDGLSHLEGLTVSGVGDGSVLPDMVVTDGQVDLGGHYDKVIIGLPYSTYVEPMGVEAIDSGASIGQTKRVRKMLVRLKDTLGMRYTTEYAVYHTIVVAGTEGAANSVSYRDVVFRDSSDAISESPELFTGLLEVPLDAPHGRCPRVILRQDAPMPFNLLGVTYLFETTEPYNVQNSMPQGGQR